MTYIRYISTYIYVLPGNESRIAVENSDPVRDCRPSSTESAGSSCVRMDDVCKVKISMVHLTSMILRHNLVAGRSLWITGGSSVAELILHTSF